MIRKTLYKLELNLKNGQTLPITLATHDIQRVESLVNKHKVLYAARGYEIDRFVIRETKYLLQLTEQQYEDEIMFCDIVDEDEQGVPISSPVGTYKSIP
jgi:hypothetical protein